MKKTNKVKTLAYSGGPKPCTERGKRRHANRDTAAQNHAKKVWAGGYTYEVKLKGDE